jgi:PAS domain S-box-containing protein
MTADTEHAPSNRADARDSRILAIVLSYAVFGTLWILLSDKLVQLIFNDPEQITLISMLKGWLYVAVTSLLLFALMRRLFAQPMRRAAVRDDKPGPSIALLALAIVVLTSAGVTHTFIHHKATEVARLQTIADLKTRQISDWLAERDSDAALIMSSQHYADSYRQWQKHGNPSRGDVLTENLEKFMAGSGFCASQIFDGQGNRLWSSKASTTSPPAELLAAVRQSSADGRARRVGPYLGMTGLTRLDFVAPLKLYGKHPPLIVLRADPENWLYKTLQTWPVPSRTGETLLIRRDGDQVIFLNQLRHRNDTALKLRMPINTDRLLAAQLLRDPTRAGSLIEGKDYRTQSVLGVARAIAGTDWYLIAKLDRSEVYGSAIDDATWIILVGLLSLVMVAAGAYLLRQRQQLAIAAEVQKIQNERLRTLSLLGAIADSSEDAIFAKDLEGRYTLFNAAAARFVGVPAEAVLGNDDRRIFPPVQAERVMADERKAIDENRHIVTEEQLDTPHGQVTFLSTKGPLRDMEGKITGIFGISRDITARKQSEQTIRDNEARYRALVEQSLAGIYILQDGLIRYVNPGFASIFGYASADALMAQASLTELVHPNDRDRVNEHIRRALSGELEIIHYNFSGVRRDGSYVDIETHGRVLDYQGRPAVIGLLLDITARKAAEDKLRVSELRFHDIANVSADWIWEIDARHVYTYASESVQDHLGHTPAEMIGKTPFDFMPEEEALRMQPIFADITARAARFRDLEYIDRHKDGSLRHVQANGMPVFTASGEFAGFRGLDRDITARKDAEIALKSLADDMAATLQAIPDLLFEVDEHGRYINIRAAQQALLIAAPAELLGHTVNEMLPPEAAQSIMAALQHAARQGTDYGRILELPLADGPRYFELSVACKRRVAGAPQHFIVLSRDITSRINAEDETRQRNQELERFNRATVGRELDMIELKRQINALALRLGEDAPYPLSFLEDDASPDPTP